MKLAFNLKGTINLFSSCSSVEYLFHKNDQGLAVVFPFLRQLALVGILVAANIDG